MQQNSVTKSCLFLIIDIAITFFVIAAFIWCLSKCFDFDFQWKYAGMAYFCFVLLNCIFYKTR